MKLWREVLGARVNWLPEALREGKGGNKIPVGPGRWRNQYRCEKRTGYLKGPFEGSLEYGR